jgi:hypothetical protein
MEPDPEISQGTFNFTLGEFEEAMRRSDERRAKAALPASKSPAKPKPAPALARQKDFIVKWG